MHASLYKDDAVANVREMLRRTLVTRQTGPAGKLVNRRYVEDGADIARELYCSPLVDRKTGKGAFVASTAGGMDIETMAEETPDRIHTVNVESSKGVTDDVVARLVDTFGLDGVAATEAPVLLAALYRAFADTDMSLLEINPFVVLASGPLRVLDAKVSFDSNAAFRRAAILDYRDLTEEDAKEIEASKHDLAYVALHGDIGCRVNGAGLAMATMHIIKLYGTEPANFLDVGGGAGKEEVTAAFKMITSDPRVKGILVNIFCGIVRCDTIAEGVVAAVREDRLSVPLVVRLEGTKVTEGKRILNESGLDVLAADDLDDAAQKIVKAVKG